MKFLNLWLPYLTHPSARHKFQTSGKKKMLSIFQINLRLLTLTHTFVLYLLQLLYQKFLEYFPAKWIMDAIYSNSILSNLDH